MRILFLTDNFAPERNAPASRVYENVCYWIRWGHQVTILTCAPNFPEGKVYEGYCNRWYSRSGGWYPRPTERLKPDSADLTFAHLELAA